MSLQLVYVGKVKLGDEYRRPDEEVPCCSVEIGGSDVVREVMDGFPKGSKVTVAMCDRSFSGDLDVDTGYSYSEVSPEDADRFMVGGSNILEMLKAAEGKDIVLVVSDEPVNMIEVMSGLRGGVRAFLRSNRSDTPSPTRVRSLKGLGRKLRNSIKPRKKAR